MAYPRRRKVSFNATKIVKKPVIVKFRRSDGSIAKFRAHKAVRIPKKVSFYTRRRKIW